MATAEEGGATTTAAASYGGERGGGAGGKFRKKPFRKTTTPYDRPAIPFRSNGSGGSWLSKLVVDPASKLISYGARRFFESVFRKRRLPPPPPPPPQTSESNRVLSDGRPEAVLSEPAGGECSNPLSSCRNGISDLEQLLEQKTFTRSEIDHLTKLLHSRAGEVSLRDGNRNREMVSDVGGHQEIKSDQMANGYAEDRSHGVDSKVVGDGIASPSELAKAYMGSRPSKLSPSVLVNHSQAAREDTKLLSNMRGASTPVSMALTTKSTVGSGSPGNGCMTNPRSLGRSAIYNMARTPYLKRSGVNLNGSGFPVPSTSLSVLENCEKSEPKSMTLKRRSFVLDDEVGSVGSIRRIRQKSNIIASGFRNTDRVGSDSDASQVSLKQKLLMNGNSKHVQRTVEENADFNIPSTSYALVPFKSNGVEGAGRRSGNLEKRPLKDRSSESNMVAVRQKSTFQLTPSMLRGQALRSMEEASTSELLHSVEDDHNIEASAGFMDADDHTSQDQGKVEEDGPVENAFPSDTHYPINNGDSAVSFEADIVRGRTSDDLEVGLSEPQNKAAFRMSALEDYVDLDDDLPNEVALRPPSEEREPFVAHLKNRKFSPLEEPKRSEACSEPELKSPSDLILSKANEASTAVAVSLGERSTGIINPASEEVTAAAPLSIPPPSVAALDKPKEIPQSLFSFSPKVADKFPSLMPESNSRTPESSSSLVDVFAPTSSSVIVPESERGGFLKPLALAAEDTNGKSDSVTSAASNGLLVSVAPFGSFTATSNNNTHQISTSPVIFTPSVTVSDSIPSGNGSITSDPSSKVSFRTSETPKVSGEPPFKFGISSNPSTTASEASTIIPAGDMKNNGVSDPSAGNSTSSSTNLVAFGFPSSGNITSGLSSFNSNPSDNNSQGSLFSSASKSLVLAFGTVSNGPSTQSNSFAPLPSSNANSTTSFVSSLSSAQVSSQIMPFGFNASASSSDTGAVASSSGLTSSLFGVNPHSVSDSSAGGSSNFTTPSVFSFGLNSSSSSGNAVGSTAPVSSSSGSDKATTGSFSSSPSPTFAFGAVGSTGAAAAPVFSFGASSSGSASVNSTSFSSSSSTSAVASTSGAAPSTFSFGMSNPASSASGSTTSFSNGAFNFGGSSSASSTAINSDNARPIPFGSSLQAPTPSMFGSSPATGFSFGASAATSQPTNAAAPVTFNSFSSAPASVFSSPSPSLSQPVFGNNFQMNGEDSMAEDPVQSTAPTPSLPAFGQPNASPSPPGFMFGSTTVQPQANPFQFGGQQNNQGAPQNPSVFQASGSLGGSFSLGSGGGDKSGRKFVKANRNKNRKK